MPPRPFGALPAHFQGDFCLLICCTLFLVNYGFLLNKSVLALEHIPFNWALKPLWRGFRDWNAVRAMAAKRARHFVVSGSGVLYDLQYEYLQGEWGADANSTPSPRRMISVALKYVREQVWLINLSTRASDVARDLIHRGSLVIETILRTILGSPHVPSLVKTLISAFILVAYAAGAIPRKQIADAWVVMFMDPVTNLVTEVHSIEQRKKRKRNQTSYDKLSSSKDMIRVLRILPGIEGQPLECWVRQEQRSSAKYEALSYVWGNPTLQYLIQLNGKRFFVGNNLYDCLFHLRAATTVRQLWVDTLCINQADAEERSQQVLLMGDLYKRAERVVVWLGPDAKGVAKLFSQARQNDAEHSGEPKLAHVRAHQSKNSYAIQHILGSPWWSRVWTVQELILGSSTIVQCGKHSLPWDSFRQRIDQNARHMKPPDLERTFYSQYLALKRERQLYLQHVAR